MGYRLVLPPGFERLLAVWSLAGPLAYAEADYVGGRGRQAAALWSRGGLSLGPFTAAGRRRRRLGRSPISRVLRELGVSAYGHADEFEAVGLGHRRDMDEWLAEAR